MASKAPLGRLERIPLREYWEREDTGFTPWLAQEENIRLLADAIGMDLEVVNQEVRVGPFRADILCRSPGGDHQVLIENQLEVTDHGHLGQLMTYAAGLEAVSIIWIAGRFTDEHRAALDWLNRVTCQGVNFFGLEVELWHIGDSLAAPKFNVVSQPNGWTKAVASASQETMTPLRQMQLEFWTAFNQYLAQKSNSFRPVKPQAGNWLVFGMGASLFALESVVNIRAGWVGVRLSFPIEYLSTIAKDKEALGLEIGADLVWSEARTVGVVLLTRGADVADATSWPTLFAWLLQYMEAFASAFKKRVPAYKAALEITEGGTAPIDVVVPT